MKAIFRLLIIPLSLLSTGIYAQNIHFVKTWDEAVAKAKETNKPIFLDCYTDWCQPCKKMEQEAFTNRTVAKFYNEHFINVKVDMETEVGKMLVDKYDVNLYPTVLYIAPDEQLWHRAVGYRYGAPQTLLRNAKRALNPNKRSERYTIMFNEGKRDKKFLYKFTKQLSKYNQYRPEVFDAYLAAIIKDSNYTAKTRKLVYKHISSFRSQAFSILQIAGFYPESMFEQYTLLSCLIADNKLAIKQKSDSMYNEHIAWGYQMIPELRKQLHTYLTVPYYTETNQLYILHDSIKNYVENYVLDSMTGEKFIAEIKDRATPKPYNPNEYVEEYTYFNTTGEKPEYYELDYNKTAWELNEACRPYAKTQMDSNYIKEAKIWMEIALTIEEEPQYLETYASILFRLNMREEALSVLDRLRTLIELHPEYGTYENAMKLRDYLYQEKNK